MTLDVSTIVFFVKPDLFLGILGDF
jgi:hypothetical protein